MRTPFNADIILDIQGDKCRFAHVAKHLYSPSERWEQLLNHPSSLRHAACVAGCVEADFKGFYPSADRAPPACMAHVLADHDQLLAPAYREALAQAISTTRGGLQHEEDKGWMLVGDAGVVVIVRKVKKQFEVKTVYRVASRGSAARSREDFFKRAVRKLRDKTSWNEEVGDEFES